MALRLRLSGQAGITFVNKETRNEDDTRIGAGFGFDRMCSGVYSYANRNANSTHRDPYEHAWANRHTPSAND